MRAVRAVAPGVVALDDVTKPAPGPGDVLVRVRACGICGTDLHWFHGTMALPAVCPGHEIAGEVAEVGAGVRALAPGDAVALEGIVGCETCPPCARGAYHLCQALQVVGMTIPGGLADYVRLPARHCFKTPHGVAPAVAALSEPLAVAVHAIRLAPLERGARVLVLGAGTIGLMGVLAARAAGAGEVVATARRPQQREAALRLGASRVFADDDRAGLETFARASPIDLVLETVGGTADTLATAVAAARPGGTICVLGVFFGAPPLPAARLLVKELTLKGSMVYNRRHGRADFEVVQDLLTAEHERLEGLVTHRVPLDDVARAFAVAADKSSGSIKVTVTTGGASA
jgi:L-iditol 2-dehydrogenase